MQEFANPDCPRCKGRGRVKTGKGITEMSVCLCAVAGLRKDTAEKLLKATFPALAREMTLARFDTGDKPRNELALKTARNFVENYAEARQDGWVLGFWGEPRTGKTHLAVAIAQACTKRFLCRPHLLNLPKALRQERERFNNPDLPSPFLAGQSADLLVIDDLGAEYERQALDQSRTSWLSEMLYQLIDERVMQKRPFIYTTNLSPADMKRRYTNEAWQRVYARLTEAEINPEGPLEVVRVDGVRRKQNEHAAELLFAS